MQQAPMKGEIMNRALMLVKSKGDEALDYANKMVREMEDSGDEEDFDYWQKISRQVELLLQERG